MQPDSPAVLSPPEPTPLPQRAWWTVAAPARLFAEFRQVTPWVGPLGVLVMVGLFVAFSTPLEVLVQQAEEAAVRSGGAELVSEPETIARWGRYINALAVLVAYPIIAFGVAGVTTLIFGTLLGGTLRFTQYLAVTTHALMVWGLGLLVTQLVLVWTRNLDFAPSVALLVPFLDAGAFAHRLLDGLNLFSLWTLGLIGYGIGTLDSERSSIHAISILLTLYLGLAFVLAVLEGRAA